MPTAAGTKLTLLGTESNPLKLCICIHRVQVVYRHFQVQYCDAQQISNMQTRSAVGWQMTGLQTVSLNGLWACRMLKNTG